MSYAIMRVQKLKSHQVHFSQNHNERNHKNYSNPDIDSEKSKDNYHLVGVVPAKERPGAN